MVRITRFTIVRRELALVKPVFTARGVTTTREVILIGIHTESGAVGIGEAAPLPDHGTETFEAAWSAAKRIAALENMPPIPHRTRDLCQWFAAADLHHTGYPALYFGIQSALIALLSMAHDVNVVDFFPGPPRPAIAVNALITGSNPDELYTSASNAFDEGFRVLKLKVGYRALDEDIEIVRRLGRAFPNTKFRLDANGAWSINDAERFCAAIDADHVEYVEDPLHLIDAPSLHRLRQTTSISIALDETAQQVPVIVPLIRERLFDVLILKPTVLGAYDLTIDLAGEALRNKLDVVVTSSLESGIGLTYLSSLAATIGSRKRAHGLSTGLLLAEDTLTEPLHPTQGELPVPSVRSLPLMLTADLQKELITA
ncbi:MAG: o-succinylbenzoate synthase [Calditrichota bacterium]